jgi:hypothetical protein
MKNVIALDPGYGNTKVCVNGATASIQSAVARPQSTGMATIGMKTASQILSVELEGQAFAIGPGAWHWGNMLTSRDYSALASPERKALAFTTLAQLLDPGEYDFELMVIGLPVPLLKDETQSQAVLGGLKAYKGEHCFQLAQGAYRINISRLKVLAQPVGAYADWLLDDELRIRKGGRQAEVATLDLGMNTLDLYVIKDGKVEPRFIGGDKVGVRRLLELITANGHDPEELDAELRAGRLRASKDQTESWLSEVLATIERTWPSLRRFDAIIPTGGGAMVLGDLLNLALIAKGAAVCWPADPVTANVKGLWKWGTYGN